MVAFGKKLRQSQIQEWQGNVKYSCIVQVILLVDETKCDFLHIFRYYINYKLMKKKVKRYTQQIQVGTQDRHNVLKDFSRLLDSQIEKIVLFLLEQQGLLASRLSNLGEQYDVLIQHPDEAKVTELQEAYRAVGRDLLRLLFFVEMNAIGLRKILKKFDKRFGYKFADYYVKTRANHPYSQLQQVFKHVGIGAVVGAISRNLADLQDLQDNHGSYVSIYDQPAYSHPVYSQIHQVLFTFRLVLNMLIFFLQDPVVHSIRAAVERLSNSTSFLHFLGTHAFTMQDELPTPSEEQDDDQRYHFMSLLLNLANTFLYMVNTYIIVPTADNYSLTLGAAATVCGVVIGSMAVAQVFSSVYFSAWSNRSYMKPLVFSSIVLLVGNTLYALAYDLDSIAVLLIGRLFCGLGSARAVNRRYISDCVPLKLRMQASAGFVSASALGMAVGPALACLFQTDFKIYKFTFNQETLPGWIMALAWLVYLLWLSISFREPPDRTKESVVPQESTSGLFTIPSIYFLYCIVLSFHILIPYTVPQYVGSALITFVSAEVLEGVNLSLLSRVMSSRLSRGTYNGGLLSTEAGTLARVIADGTITLSGYLGESKLLNTTLVPALFICISSIVATCFTYNSLY
ncbi:hypothetical protein FEM48_Zijuj12G0132600 [Ziziphus jujuba var. spinosa]|uniref:SPX domain-containing protein n=1 Tax=Ziziphus jujuba var. spinosa TaxID=714518 RepID=A0A978UDJ6_ZIZJJ|nr:hypothetical protein FEM48_Zijuj12G0132600 [Ziziphus jujuba var. spinosa]